MRIDWTYDGCDEHDVPAIEQYWTKVGLELEGKLAELSESASELRIAVERDESEGVWEFQAALHVPGRTLVAGSTAVRPELAMNDLLRQLASRIDALEEAPVRLPQRRDGIAAVGQLLSAWRAENRSRPFLSFLTPLVKSLGPYVQRELNVRELDGRLVGEELTTPDVLHEVLVLAWEQFERRNGQLALDLWLVQLAEQVLDRLSSHLASSSLDEESASPSRDVLASDGDAWIEQVSYPETIELSDLLPDGPGVASWDDLDLDSKQTHLASMLSRVDREPRQAFVLHLAHGYEIAEIADFQNRPLADVGHDIAHTTAQIRRWLADEQSPDQEETFIRAELRSQRRRR